jgi:hypothetical protein
MEKPGALLDILLESIVRKLSKNCMGNSSLSQKILRINPAKS